MAWRRTALLVLLVGMAGCGAVPDPPPRPTPPPDARIIEDQGALKAATWRAAAAAEARRLARLHAAIRRARKSTSVTGALRLALLTERISPETRARREPSARRGAPAPRVPRPASQHRVLDAQRVPRRLAAHHVRSRPRRLPV